MKITPLKVFMVTITVLFSLVLGIHWSWADANSVKAYVSSQIPIQHNRAIGPQNVLNSFNAVIDNVGTLADTISATNISGTNISATNLSTDSFNPSNITTGNISATNISATNFSTPNFNISLVSASVISATNISATNFDITNLNTTNVSASSISATTFTASIFAPSLISTSTISATNISVTNIGIGNLVSALDNSYISPSYAGLGVTIGQLYAKAPIDVRNFGVIVDGQPHANNLANAQRALDLARFGKIRVDLCPAVVSGTELLGTVYGTNTTVNLEGPLKFISHTAIMPSGKCLHNINSGNNSMLEQYYESLADTQDYKQAEDVQIIGGIWDTVSRTSVSAQSRKMIIMANMKAGTGNMVVGTTISLTSNIGSFGLQTRNGGDILMAFNTVKMVPRDPHASGGDACHKHGNSDGERWIGNICWGDDDGCSETLEGSAMSGMVQRNGLWANNDCRSYSNSGMKHSVGEQSANNARIINSMWRDNYFGVMGTKYVGNAYKIQQDGTSTNSISDGLTLQGNTFDCTNCERNTGAGAGPNGTMIAEQLCGLRNVTIEGMNAQAWSYRGMEITPFVCNWRYRGGQVNGYIEVSKTTTQVGTVSYTTANTYQVIPSDTSIVTTSLVSASTGYYVSVTAGAPLERWQITGVNAGTSFNVSRLNAVSTTNLANVSFTVVFRPGTYFNVRGNNRYGTIEDVEITDPPRFVDLNQQSGFSSYATVVQNNRIYNFRDDIAMSFSAANLARIERNSCVDSTGNRCINVTSSTAVTSYTLIDNRDYGTSTTQASFNPADLDIVERRGNVGTNSDFWNFYPFGTVSATTVSATTATIGGLLTVGGQVSASAVKVLTTLTVPCAVTADIGNIAWTQTYNAYARCQAVGVFHAVSTTAIDFSPTVP